MDDDKYAGYHPRVADNMRAADEIARLQAERDAARAALEDVLAQMRWALAEPDLRRQHIEVGVQIAERALGAG